jgi:hypothetical protein
MTTTVYLDESGDLGFDFAKAQTSRYFVVAALVCDNPQPVAKAVKKVFAGFSKTQVKRSHGVLHAYKEDEATRRKLLRFVAALNVEIVVMWLDKRRAFTNLKDDPHALYSYLVNALPVMLIRSKRW